MTGQKYCRATVLGADVALCISSCSPHPFFCHRQRGTVSQLTAAFHYCNAMSQVRELCRGADRNKKTAHRAIFFLAPQTEIPLTGEMSRSDKRVTARYEQLEPVTLNMLSATAVASLYRYDKTIHRIVLSATDNSRVPLLQCDVAGERTVQRCRQKQKDRTSCDLFFGASNRDSPDRGNVTE